LPFFGHLFIVSKALMRQAAKIARLFTTCTKLLYYKQMDISSALKKTFIFLSAFSPPRLPFSIRISPRPRSIERGAAKNIPKTKTRSLEKSTAQATARCFLPPSALRFSAYPYFR